MCRKSIKAIIFDVGGVLVNTKDHGPREQLAAKVGLSLNELYAAVFGSDTWNLAQTGVITNDEHWQAVGRRLGFDWPNETNTFRSLFFAGDQLDRELIALIQQWHANYKIALLSNAAANLRRWIEQEWEIPGNTFDEIVISAEEGIIKPAPEIYHIALNRLGIVPHQAIFVDDLLENVQAAQSLGIHAIHHITRERTVAQIQALLATL